MLEEAKENESFGVSMSLSELIVSPFLTVLAAKIEEFACVKHCGLEYWMSRVWRYYHDS